MKNSQKGFVIPIIIAIAALLALGGGYVYYKSDEIVTKLDLPISDNNLPGAPSLRTYVSNNFGLEFKYPPEILVSEDAKEITLNHSIPFKSNACNWKDGAISNENLSDFGVTIKVYSESLVDTVKLESPFMSADYLVNGELALSPGWIDSYKVGLLNGYSIYVGAEGCGYTTYYFPLYETVTLVVRRNQVTEFSGVLLPEVKEKVLAVPGVISPDKADMIFEQILSSIKYETPSLMNLPLYIQDKSYVATSSCSVTKKVIYQVPKTTAVADASLKILFSDELSAYGEYKSVSIVNGVAKIILESDLTKAGRPINSLSSCESSHLLSVLNDTLKQYASIKSIELFSPRGQINF